MLRCFSFYQHEEPNETAIPQRCRHTSSAQEEFEGAPNFAAAVGTVVIRCEDVAVCVAVRLLLSLSQPELADVTMASITTFYTTQRVRNQIIAILPVRSNMPFAPSAWL